MLKLTSVKLLDNLYKKFKISNLDDNFTLQKLMIEAELEKALNQIVNLLVSMEKRLKNIELELKKDDKKRLLNG